MASGDSSDAVGPAGRAAHAALRPQAGKRRQRRGRRRSPQPDPERAEDTPQDTDTAGETDSSRSKGQHVDELA